jgi:hypothetical protein
MLRDVADFRGHLGELISQVKVSIFFLLFVILIILVPIISTILINVAPFVTLSLSHGWKCLFLRIIYIPSINIVIMVRGVDHLDTC